MSVFFMLIMRGHILHMKNVRLKKRKDAMSVVNEFIDNPSNYLIIHYSCESFYNIKDGRTPRVTSIAIRYLKTGQTKTFSIHKIAEKKSLIDKIESHYDYLEKEMLKEYFNFIKENKNYTWIHWNMRDINYGFQAIENRYEVLGGKPINIEDNMKIDLARLMVDLYGLSYIKHPRLDNLIDKNHITKKDYLIGSEEALCFENKEFIKLHQYTLRKVDILNTIIEKLSSNSLKTEAKLKEIYGLNPQGIHEMIKDRWYLSLICWLITIIISGIVGFQISIVLS